MLAAFLSTRSRGAAVLIGIPREDACCPCPHSSIPPMERRILGSIYGSARPERDFADHPRRLSSRPPSARPSRLAPLPLDDVAQGFELMRSGVALRVVLDLVG